MERAEPNTFGAFACRFDYAVLHLARGFVGEREAENAFAGELRVGFKQVANAFGDDARLARAGARDNEKRPFAVLDGSALLRVEGDARGGGVLRI